MKTRNKFLALALTCALSVSLAVPAMAVNDGVLSGTPDGFDITQDDTTYKGGEEVENGGQTVEGKEYTYKDSNGQTVPFVGIIKPTQIKATIPTKVVFDIDPTIEVWDDSYTPVKSVGDDQVTAPTDIKIKNNSTVPMWVYVASVTTNNATLVNSNAASELNDEKTVMFGLDTTASQVDGINDAAKGNWIVPLSTLNSTPYATGGNNVYKTYTSEADNTHYILNSTEANGAADAQSIGPVKASTADGATPGEMQLYINAVTKAGYRADETFTVMPVIVVAVKNPDDTTPITAGSITPPVNVLQPEAATPAA